MKRIAVIFIVISLLINTPVLAQENFPKTPKSEKANIEAKVLDPRAQVLQAYLTKYNSPAKNHASDFIEAADKYNLDWKLVPSIAGVESTFCKFIPGGVQTRYTSYNCWGWGVYGTQAIYFKSFREGIFTVSEGLKKRYIDKGLLNPYTMNKVYASSPTWGRKVAYFIDDLARFEFEYKQKNGMLTKLNLQSNEAGYSATPAQIN